MIRQPQSEAREIVVANAIRELVSELRMVELADYVAFIRMERFANLADIVESAAELYFMPGTVRMGNGAEAHLGWSEPPNIVLDLELRPAGANVYFTLRLGDKEASVDVNYVSFDAPLETPEGNTALLEASLSDARIRKTMAWRRPQSETAGQ